jgi:hypothetical protein
MAVVVVVEALATSIVQLEERVVAVVCVGLVG